VEVLATDGGTRPVEVRAGNAPPIEGDVTWGKVPSAEYRMALQLARQEAQRVGRSAIDTLDLLVGILKCSGARAAAYLLAHGIDLRGVRDAADTAPPSAFDPTQWFTLSPPPPA